METFNGICLVVLGIVIGIIGCIVRSSQRDTISFKEQFQVTSLPIISLICGGRELNFLIDTGATQCLIAPEVLNSIPYKKCRRKGFAKGIGGGVSTILREIYLKYKNSEYEVQVWTSSDMEGTFKMAGVDGLLGSDFLKKYGWRIDYKLCKLYID